jgi:hypothetical protein
MSETEVGCPDCGQRHTETDGDPAPGICAACFQRRTEAMQVAMERDMERNAGRYQRDPQAMLRRHYRYYMEEGGMSPQAAGYVIVLQAKALGLLAPKEALASAGRYRPPAGEAWLPLGEEG